MPPEERLTIKQDDLAIRCSAPSAGGPAVQWSYLLDGTETRARIGGDKRNSVAKWEGAALLINTLVSGSSDYTVMDRWKLSRDRSTLTITRQVVQRSGTTESTVVYRREGLSVREAPANAPPAPAVTTVAPAVAPAPTPAPGFGPVAPKPAQQTATQELLVLAGTHIALTLRNAVDTKHSHEGDHVYLETVVPVAVNDHIVIPRGSFVNGTITESKPAHGVKGKGELFLRFDSLTLPNGVTRDFRSRLASASSARGQVDSKEGKITGERDGSGDARTVALGTGIGASVGGIAGSPAGHGLEGVGIGAAAGAAAGLASIFHGKRAEAVLPQGTTVDMVLDRDLRFSRSEVPF
jgi:type IV secretion system protein VirB10